MVLWLCLLNCFRLGQVLKAMVALGIFLTYSLLFYAAVDILWPKLESHFKRPLAAEYVFRIILVIATGKLDIITIITKLKIYENPALVYWIWDCKVSLVIYFFETFCKNKKHFLHYWINSWKRKALSMWSLKCLCKNVGKKRL